MKKLLYIALLSLFVISCDKDDENLPAPSNVTNVSAEPRVGAALVKWEIPSDSAFTYLEVRYKKNGKDVLEKVSKFTDTLLVEGLINAEEFSFEVQTVNETPTAKTDGQILTTEPVRPIKRKPEITYFPDDLQKQELIPEIIDTYTQEERAGPKEDLIDGDPDTFWHSAWSSGVQPLPHWVQINFKEEKEIGAVKYRFRKNADVSGRPSQFGLEISSDGENWERVWESRENLPVDDNSREYKINFDENYSSSYFRVMFLKNGGQNYVHLGELSVYKMKSAIVDKEEEAEEEYYNF
ncbi:DUF4959 domain-containing protein [Salegentibacter sp. BLCTC]|uniref:F5/8 type C domain-containing protein n=1 Tax=Salegentibacter echinorum TaxID=1073325 RepID=A0A1M5KUB5_SALEC|nr:MULTISPECIES: discoidin domain-containing protein [Salegentibacter]MBE7640018.1 DUF4959 domain-containing protein [Salegentibacter sp. BLCTC]SHG56335.1 protein of unknown function [Salegentibacter echinorum]